MKISARWRAVLQALLVTFLWSTSWVLIKTSLEEIPPLIFAGLRYSLAALILLPGLRYHRKALHTLTRTDWVQLAVLGLVFYTLTQGGQFLTLKYLPATTFSLLLNFTTVLVAVFGIFGLKEIPSGRQWMGILIFLAGVLLFFYPSISVAGPLLGLLVAGFTVLANAVASFLGRSVNRQQRFPPLVVTVISMGIGAMVLLTIGIVTEDWPSLGLKSLGVILWLAVVNTAFAFTLWNKSLQTLSAVESSIINNTMLVQIAILAWVFLGERLDTLDILGLGLASVGILLANLKSRGRSDETG